MVGLLAGLVFFDVATRRYDKLVVNQVHWICQIARAASDIRVRMEPRQGFIAVKKDAFSTHRCADGVQVAGRYGVCGRRY